MNYYFGKPLEELYEEWWSLDCPKLHNNSPILYPYGRIPTAKSAGISLTAMHLHMLNDNDVQEFNPSLGNEMSETYKINGVIFIDLPELDKEIQEFLRDYYVYVRLRKEFGSIDYEFFTSKPGHRILLSNDLAPIIERCFERRRMLDGRKSYDEY